MPDTVAARALVAWPTELGPSPNVAGRASLGRMSANSREKARIAPMALRGRAEASEVRRCRHVRMRPTDISDVHVRLWWVD